MGISAPFWELRQESCKIYRYRYLIERERDNTLLHRDKDLSTCRLFFKSVPDDKHGNTDDISRETERQRDRQIDTQRE